MIVHSGRTTEALFEGARSDAKLFAIGIDKMTDVDIPYFGCHLAGVFRGIPEQGVGGLHPVLLEAAENGSIKYLLESTFQFELIYAGKTCQACNGGWVLDIF